MDKMVITNSQWPFFNLDIDQALREGKTTTFGISTFRYEPQEGASVKVFRTERKVNCLQIVWDKYTYFLIEGTATRLPYNQWVRDPQPIGEQLPVLLAYKDMVSSGTRGIRIKGRKFLEPKMGPGIYTFEPSDFVETNTEETVELKNAKVLTSYNRKMYASADIAMEIYHHDQLVGYLIHRRITEYGKDKSYYMTVWPEKRGPARRETIVDRVAEAAAEALIGEKISDGSYGMSFEQIQATDPGRIAAMTTLMINTSK